MSINDVKYRIVKKNFNVVAIQWFDLYDYDDSGWLKNHKGEPLELETKEQAEQVVAALNPFISIQKRVRLISRILEYG